jgi:hypothetical protein
MDSSRWSVIQFEMQEGIQHAQLTHRSNSFPGIKQINMNKNTGLVEWLTW